MHPSGTATAPQPDLAHYFLPSNDHPRDKASFDFRFDVPAGLTAVANGVPLAKWTSGGRTHSVFVQRQPMATELIQLAVGDYDVTYEGFHNGVLLRDVTAKPLTAKYPAAARPHPVPARLDAGPRRRATRSTSTARSWSTPTSASRWRRRRSS